MNAIERKILNKDLEYGDHLFAKIREPFKNSGVWIKGQPKYEYKFICLWCREDFNLVTKSCLRRRRK